MPSDLSSPDKSKTLRSLILLIFFSALFAFFHFREAQVEILELNTIAPNYVVSQIDFDFPDAEATAILRQDALRDLGKIYQLSQLDIRQKRIEFENFLLYNQAWHELGKDEPLHDLYEGIDLIEKALGQLRLTDARTLEKLQQQNLNTQHFQIYTPNTLFDEIILPSFVWEQLQHAYFPRTPSLTTTLIIEFFKHHHWHLEEDIPTQQALRKRIQGGIGEKMTHISAGNRLIDQGDRVTPRHVAMFQAMQQALRDSRQLAHPVTIIGSTLLTGVFIALFWAYFRTNFPFLLHSNRQLGLLVTLFIVTMLLLKCMEFAMLNARSTLADALRCPLLVPLAAILMSSLINVHVATFSTCFLAITSTIALTFEWEEFLLLNLITALIAILNTRAFKRRKEIFVICSKAWCCAVLVIFALHFYTNQIHAGSLLIDVLSAGFFLFLSAVLVMGFLPLLESCFSITTDVSLMEYMDPNNTLLRRLTIEAPGTYQHSVLVGNLAEAAAVAIGANGLFCRVATLYHDIGKIVTSPYFTENQMEGVNIHQLLTPQESADVIMAHVREGVALARHAGLPEALIDIIKEHHGTTLVYYFYRKEVERMGGDLSQVDKQAFRYPGPRPRSKESGIIMLVDSFEAASRSLDQIDEGSLTQLIERVSQEKIEDGQFDQCALTFEELSIVKETVVKTLLATRHTRVKYPLPEREIVPLEERIG